MKFLLILLLSIVVISQQESTTDDNEHLWDLFKIQHQKHYEEEEEETRKRTFYKALSFIVDHNAKYDRGEVGFTVGLNSFADQEPQDFFSKMHNLVFSNVIHIADTVSEVDLQTDTPCCEPEVDWRKKGAVTRVRDQDPCGACWAFSAVGSLEAQHFLKTNQLVELSVQNLIDCSTNHHNKGCKGGLMDAAFHYIKMNEGIAAETFYPFEKSTDVYPCRYDPKHRATRIKAWMRLKPADNETLLQMAVKKFGPISVAIDSNYESFMRYEGKGLWEEPACSTTNTTHAVLIVGYGTTKKGEDYWLVKNSYGESWGLNGYFLLARNKGNTCGIASFACFPKVLD